MRGARIITLQPIDLIHEHRNPKLDYRNKAPMELDKMREKKLIFMQNKFLKKCKAWAYLLFNKPQANIL